MENTVQKYNFTCDVCERLQINVLQNEAVEAGINRYFI